MTPWTIYGPMEFSDQNTEVRKELISSLKGTECHGDGISYTYSRMNKQFSVLDIIQKGIQ